MMNLRVGLRVAKTTSQFAHINLYDKKRKETHAEMLSAVLRVFVPAFFGFHPTLTG